MTCIKMTAFRPHSHHLGVARSVLGDAGFPRLPWMYLWVYSRCFWVRSGSESIYGKLQSNPEGPRTATSFFPRRCKTTQVVLNCRDLKVSSFFLMPFGSNLTLISLLDLLDLFFLHINDLGMVENVEFEPLVNCSSRESQRMVVFKATLFWILSYDNWL